MANINQIRDQIDLHDLASRLSLERLGNKGNYRSPHPDCHNGGQAAQPATSWSLEQREAHQ